MRQLDIELVTVGPSHAEQLRSIWLEMLAGSPGVFYERLDEAMALGAADWRDRAVALSSRTSTAIAAMRNGIFIGLIAGYVDHAGVEAEGHISHFHVAAHRPGTLPTRGQVASLLLEALAGWSIARGVEELFIGVHDDRVTSLDQLLGLGFVPSGVRRESQLDTDCEEVELVCMLSGLAYDNVLHPTTGARPASSPEAYRYRVV